MGIGIKSLMAAAHAAGYSMAAEDIYLHDDLAEEHSVARPVSTALVPVGAAGAELSLMEQARSAAGRYLTTSWLTPRLPA